MKKIIYRSKIIVVSFFILLLFTACGGDKKQEAGVVTDSITLATMSLEPKPATNRWFTQAQLEQGREIFATHCAVCHGANAEATSDWKTVDANGAYPPPPLNGSAHAWHHPLAMLRMSIKEGGQKIGGQMPAFGHVLSESEMLAAIASFQYYWPDEVYDRWLEFEASTRQ